MSGKSVLKRILFALAGASCATLALPTTASAYYDTIVCNRDGYDCYRVRCDDEGDSCYRIAHYRQRPYRDWNGWAYPPPYSYDRDDDDRRGWHGYEEENEDDD